MNWKLYTVIFIVLALLVAVAYIYNNSRKQGFQNQSAGLDKPRFTICYADWCGHCHTMMPHFDAASKSANKSFRYG